MELKIEHISKRFKDKMAVDDVSLTLTTGVWGLLGANGAGKTTLMRMIADIMEPSNGSISFDGEDIRKMGANYRNIFGFLPQDFGYSRDFTVKDYLEYIGGMSFWTPHIILISAAIEVPIFLFLAVRSYCKHQVA